MFLSLDHSRYESMRPCAYTSRISNAPISYTQQARRGPGWRVCGPRRLPYGVLFCLTAQSTGLTPTSANLKHVRVSSRWNRTGPRFRTLLKSSKNVKMATNGENPRLSTGLVGEEPSHLWPAFSSDPQGFSPNQGHCVTQYSV